MTGPKPVADGQLMGILAITVTALLWGTTGTAATFAPDAGPLAIGAAALGIGGILQALIALPALKQSWSVLAKYKGIVFIGAIGVFVYPLAFYSSMHLAGVAIGSVVSLASAPLASGVLERVLDHSRLSRWWMLAAGTGVVGSVMLCVSRMGSETASSTDTVFGIAVGLLAGVSYAGYTWAVHRLIFLGAGRGASMGSVFGAGGLLLMPVLVITGKPLVESAEAFGVAAYMALVPMFLGYLLFGFGLTRVSASTATTVTLTEPAIATLLAVVIVGERLDSLGWAGLALLAVVLIILGAAPTNVGEREGGWGRREAKGEGATPAPAQIP